MQGWYLLAGLLFLGMALVGSFISKVPISAAILYLAVGVLIGPHGIHLLRLHFPDDAALVESITEAAILVSLFGAGLKLRLPIRDRRWLIPLRLAYPTMAVTVGLVALVGVCILGFSWGEAVLLGAILGPTDPVLASAVQVEHPFQKDRLRFNLTGEAGLNDGSAMPFALLALFLLGEHSATSSWLMWVLHDLLWMTIAGLGLGFAIGFGIARIALYLRERYRGALGLDGFFVLGLIGVCYGCAELIDANGFLAVFAGGLAIRMVERHRSGEDFPEAAKSIHIQPEWRREIATRQETAPFYFAQTALHFNNHLDNVAEAVVVVLVGAMLTVQTLSVHCLWFVLLLFLLIRPVSVAVGLLGRREGAWDTALMSWFGVRGIGSVYYLTFAAAHGIARSTTQQLVPFVFTAIAASAVLHGTSVLPLMKLYSKHSDEQG